MKKIKILILAVCVSFTSMAQISTLLYNSKHIPQKNVSNPAFFVNSGGYMSFPSVNLDFSSPLSYNNCFKYSPDEDVLIIQTESILENLALQNELNMDLTVGILGFGFKAKRNFYTFGIQLRNNVSVGLPRDLLSFVVEGNIDENDCGRNLTLIDEDLLNISSYVEYAFGFGRQMNDKITLGARAKLLQGVFNANTLETKVMLNTDPGIRTIGIDMDYLLRVSSPLSYNFDEFEVLTYFPNNWGYALDFGLNYQISNRISFAASVLDIGQIYWKENVAMITPTEGSGNITFSGLEWESLFSEEGQFNENFFSNLGDSLLNEMSQYDIDTISQNPYWETLPWKVNVSVNYDLNKVLGFSLMYRGEKRKFDFYNSVTAGVNINLWDWLEIMACNTINDLENGDLINPGAGFSMSLFKVLQLYTLVDYTDAEYLVDGKSFRFLFGLNLVF